MAVGRLGVSLILVLALARSALACLWDNDTLRDERRGLPGIAEILAGKWERHSAFFYEKRVEAMKTRLAADDRDGNAYDNLAVALEKSGDPDAAIEVMLRKEKVLPGHYTTYANLGTFYLHKGDFENGTAYIRKALAINPDAHFGRETYQLQVAEYLLRANSDPAVLDRGSFVRGMLVAEDEPGVATRPVTLPVAGEETEPLDRMLLVRTARGRRDERAIEKAITGVVGMIRFGTGKSPHLYFALGDLLAARGDKHLAYRAYKRATDFDHPRPELVREAVDQVKEMVERPADFDDAVIARERSEAEAWVAAYQRYEDALVRSGKDTDDDVSYNAFYAEHGPAVTPVTLTPLDRLRRLSNERLAALAGLVIIACVALIAVGVRLLRRTIVGRPTATAR